MDNNFVNLGINHLKTWPSPASSNAPGVNFGVLAGEPGFGTDANMTDYRATLYPKIKVNPVIEVSASVNLTSLGIHSGGRPYANPINDFSGAGAYAAGNFALGGGYYNSLWVPIEDRPAGMTVPNTFVTLQWWKMSIKTPTLNFSLGYKTGVFGLGLWKNDRRSSASVSMNADYGPFVFNWTPYFGRTRSDWNVFARDSQNVNNPWRKDDDRDYLRGQTWDLRYANGPLLVVIGIDGHVTSAYRRGTYAGRAFNGTPPSIAAVAGGLPNPNQWSMDTFAALKYFNGRFFFNGEVDHFWQYQSGRGSANAAGTRVNADKDQDAWMYGVTFGTVTGPAKFTLSYVRATGDDPSTRATTEDALQGDAGVSADFLREWGMLMYYFYGTGTGWDSEGIGQPTNFHHVGGRLDYAVASNLNVFGVYSQAWRDQPNAYVLGGNGINTLERFTNEMIRVPSANTPAVPNHARDIGWEVNVGANWKLLENLNWNLLFAYWKPGNWWSYAYPNTVAIYRANGGAAIGAADRVNSRFNLGRNIDPIIYFETELAVSF